LIVGWGVATAAAYVASAQAPSTSGLERPASAPSPIPSASASFSAGAFGDDFTTLGTPDWSATHLIDRVTSLWTNFRDRLEFERRVGDPTRLEPTTEAALKVAAADADRYLSEWKLRYGGRYMTFRDYWSAGPEGLSGEVIVLDEGAARSLLGSIEGIFRRHIDTMREGPDLLAYILTKNEWVRENWREGAKLEEKIVKYGWVIGLGIIAVQAGTNKAKFSFDIKIMENKERDTRLKWRTKVDHFGVRLEPGVRTGILYERKLLSAEALIGARLVRDGWNYGVERPEATLRVEHRWLDLLQPENPKTYVRLRTDVRMPLASATNTEDFVTLRNSLELTHTFPGGDRLDLGVHEETRDLRFSGAGVGFRYTPTATTNLSIFGEANYNNHRYESLYAGPKDDVSFFLGLMYKF
jgi:hypothetical protein